MRVCESPISLMLRPLTVDKAPEPPVIVLPVEPVNDGIVPPWLRVREIHDEHLEGER